LLRLSGALVARTLNVESPKHEPARHLMNHRQRRLQVGIDHNHGVTRGVIKTGRTCSLVTEIARER